MPQSCGSRNSFYMGAKCRFVLVACPPKSGLRKDAETVNTYARNAKDISIQACEANTLSRICRSILVQWQEDVLLKTSRLTAGILGTLGSRAWPDGQVGQLASVSQNPIGVEARRSAARCCQQGNPTIRFPWSAAWSS